MVRLGSEYTRGKSRGTKIIGSRSLTFLDLPFEIRLAVYALLEAVVATHKSRPDTALYAEDASREARVGTICDWHMTRRGLRLASKLIEQEWTPFFFHSTTICLDHNRDPWQFGNVYLRNLEHAKIENIRNLEYEGSRHGHAEDLHGLGLRPYETRALEEIRNIVQRYEKQLHLECITVRLMGHISPDLINPLLRHSASEAGRVCVDFDRLEARGVFPRGSLTRFAKCMLAGPFAGASARSFAVPTALQVRLRKPAPIAEEDREGETSTMEAADSGAETCSSDLEREDDFVSEDGDL